MKAGPYFQKTPNATAEHDPPFGRFTDATEDLERSTLAGPVAPDYAEHLTFFDFETHVLECPELLQSITLKDLPAPQHVFGFACDIPEFLSDDIAQRRVPRMTLAPGIVRNEETF
jgi:hypothetical protein